MAADTATDAGAASGGARRSGRRFWLWTGLAAFVVWHAIFDFTIDRGMKAYVAAADRHAEGRGPAVSMRASMSEARASGARSGLIGAAVVAGVAAVGRVAWARRRHRA